MDYINDTVAAVMLELEAVAGEEDFDETAEVMVERMKRAPDPSQFLEPVILFIEENPDTEFGEPGALVHFAESYYKNGYEELLVKSIQRRPTRHSLWMLNRMINDLSNPDRDSYIALMRTAAGFSELNEEARAEVAMYLTYIDIMNENRNSD